MLTIDFKAPRLICALILAMWSNGFKAQYQLSPEAEIHIVTCGPYQGELYSAFGHSAIRVKDPQLGMDWLFNYGIFDFNQPHFYLNFARGFLNYQLAVSDYEPFKQMYISENRFIHEQVLNLKPEEKQSLFNFLLWNAQPENRYYLYDYFYDNCATRVRDAVKFTFGDKVEFKGDHIKTQYTIRDLTDLYLQKQPWGDLGIDLCLGLPMDTLATPWMYMYLPDYLEKGFENASILRDGQKVPLVKNFIVTFKGAPSEGEQIFFTPMLVFSLLLLFSLVLLWAERRSKIHFTGFDTVWQCLIGLLGWFLLALWLLTDHEAAAENYNILWAFPLYFPLCFLIKKRSSSNWLKFFYLFIGLLHLINLLIWHYLPQDLHDSLQPLVLLFAIRDILLYYRLKQIQPEQ